MRHQVLDTRVGHLFDLGPDGLGFIAEHEGQLWAFQQKHLDQGVADNAAAFAALDGRKVRFSIANGQVRQVALASGVGDREVANRLDSFISA